MSQKALITSVYYCTISYYEIFVTSDELSPHSIKIITKSFELLFFLLVLHDVAWVMKQDFLT